MEKHIARRLIMAKGMEHIVLSPLKTDKYVIKVPRILNRLSFWPYDPVSIIREELDEARKLVKDTRVQIPRTNIHPGISEQFGNPYTGYVIRQHRIIEDQSVSDIQKYLEEEKLSSLVEEFKHEPRNFISNEGSVYWVDPTKGFMGRVFERSRVMDLNKWRKIKVFLHKPIRLIGL